MGQDREDRKGGGAHVTANGQQPERYGAQPFGAQPFGAQPAGAEPAGAEPAYPGAPPDAPSFEEEIESAVEYERGLAVKALLSVALVALVLVLRVSFFG
jgi:hypothetical protein